MAFNTVVMALYIKGSLFLGYLGQAAQDADGWYATGDLLLSKRGAVVVARKIS